MKIKELKWIVRYLGLMHYDVNLKYSKRRRKRNFTFWMELLVNFINNWLFCKLKNCQYNFVHLWKCIYISFYTIFTYKLFVGCWYEFFSQLLPVVYFVLTRSDLVVASIKGSSEENWGKHWFHKLAVLIYIWQCRWIVLNISIVFYVVFMIFYFLHT